MYIFLRFILLDVQMMQEMQSFIELHRYYKFHNLVAAYLIYNVHTNKLH